MSESTLWILVENADSLSPVNYNFCSRASEVKIAQSCPTVCDPHGLYIPWNSLGQDTKVGSLSLLQGIFPTQGSNPGLPQCKQILYQLSHKGSSRIKESINKHLGAS